MRRVLLPSSDFKSLLAQVAGHSSGFTFQIDLAGTSMVPRIHPHDRLTIQTTAPEDLALEDVVLYRNKDDLLIAHRLVEWNRDVIPPLAILQGQSTTAPKEPVELDRLIGKVIHIQHPGPLRKLARRIRRKLRNI